MHRPSNQFSHAMRLTWCLLLVTLLAACANSVAPPSVVQGLTEQQKSALRLKDVTAEAAPGVAMTHGDLARIVSTVKAEIGAVNPNAMAPVEAGDKPMVLKIIITRYDQGNVVARFMLAGLGQIHLNSEVVLSDAETGAITGTYQISKNFSFGGVYGVITDMQDVEKGFAKSVAAALKPKG